MHASILDNILNNESKDKEKILEKLLRLQGDQENTKKCKEELEKIKAQALARN